MNKLELEIKMVKVIRKVLSFLFIISAVFWFAGHYNRLNAFDIIYSVIMLVIGIVFLSGMIGTEKISIRINEAFILIKWIGEVRGRQFLYTDIDRICLKKFEVEIERMGKKRIRYNLDNLEVWQKKEVYDYFIKFSKEKAIVVERHFETD
jgi:hypothetical protein